MNMIRKTDGVCGGSARIRDTRIPVWQIIEMIRFGMCDREIIESLPSLTEDDINAAMLHWFFNPEEIDAEIEANRTA